LGSCATAKIKTVIKKLAVIDKEQSLNGKAEE
jgi:hypothetical protein